MATSKQLEKMSEVLAKRQHAALTKAIPQLSYAELRVLPHILMGKSANDIAKALKLSPFTVSNHTRKILKAFGTTQRSVIISSFVTLPIPDLDEAAPEEALV